MATSLDQLCINTIRTLSIDGVQKANSGHPGLPLGCAAMAYVVWAKQMRHDPADSHWINRDRFVLSAGHGSMLLYSMLHLSGYDLSLDELKSFRQWGSKTPGHPELHLTPGVEATTGPLGQGVGNIVGMAIARENLAATFGSDLINFRVFGICSDGDLMEGISAEAASLAGHLGLGCITLLYDDNKITIDGSTAQAFTEDVGKRFEAYGWHVVNCDGLDPDAVNNAVQLGISETSKPTLIRCRTTIGFGSPNKAGTAKVHGAPLGAEELALTKKNLGWNETESFHIPTEVSKHFRQIAKTNAEHHGIWTQSLHARCQDAAFSARWSAFWNRELPVDWIEELPKWSGAEKPLATRKASEKTLHALSATLNNMIGGSADLVESNLTYLEGQGDFQIATRGGRNLRFGIREHGMGAILNGIVSTAPYVSFGATFLCFLDYMKPAVRIAALSHLPVIYVYTHDSIGLGEDGPTHQPIEHVWHMRTIPNLFVFRPGDANETSKSWKLAVERTQGPSALVLTRQNLPILDQAIYGDLQVERGGYILAEATGGEPQIILLATGSELQHAVNARLKLEVEGIPTRVVSMPCVELFESQSAIYRESVLPKRIRARVAMEAGATTGWWKYVGLDGDVIGLDHYGASAPGDLLMEKFGFTAENFYRKAMDASKRAQSRALEHVS
jgi:transketolase